MKIRNIQNIFKLFNVSGTYKEVNSYGSGHINDTFLVKTQEEDEPDYIVQRINHNVFENVPALMKNIWRVTNHINNKLSRPGLQVVKACDDKLYVNYENEFWRAYVFIANSKSYDVVKTSAQAYKGGQAFGSFQKCLSDLPGEPLFESIKDFHNINWRLEQFAKALKADCLGRAKKIKSEMAFVKTHADMMRVVYDLGVAGAIPLRVTHNDTKFNNILFDENDDVVCVVDLDTVMPGYVHYDYSDCLRTVANNAAEDEADLSKVYINMDLFAAFSRGFLEEVADKLTLVEKQSLATSVKIMPFMIGLRFLTDYLEGDHYFKYDYEEHNLIRARAQFQLTKSIIEQEVQIGHVLAEFL